MVLRVKVPVARKKAKRNYRKEYDNYHSSPLQIKKRDSRNAANILAKKKGIIKKGDGKDIHHKNGNPKDNNPKNLVAQKKSVNRSFARTRTATKRNPRA
tara:strand:- start:140 stop:436 length:297 start_codon:yes stop_codon:yes gene_type:complete